MPGELPQFEGLVEQDGELVKVISTRVDNFTVIRRAVPVTEAEFEKIREAVEARAKKDQALLDKHAVTLKAVTPDEPIDTRVKKHRGRPRLKSRIETDVEEGLQ